LPVLLVRDVRHLERKPDEPDLAAAPMPSL
jgi:hypothetical protein